MKRRNFLASIAAFFCVPKKSKPEVVIDRSKLKFDWDESRYLAIRDAMNRVEEWREYRSRVREWAPFQFPARFDG